MGRGWLLVCAWYYGLSELMLGVTGICYLMVQKVDNHTGTKYIAKSEVKQQLMKVLLPVADSNLDSTFT